MTTLQSIFSPAELQDALYNNRVRMQSHPTITDLRILNYTEKTAYARDWDRVTLACRGLIFREDTGEVLARPFRKFFNYGEAADPWEHNAWGGLTVQDKLDGSLGIGYMHWGQLHIATRGSFSSDQAIEANKILSEKYPAWQPPVGFTPLFEIIYPANRIVVDYGAERDLYLLGYVKIEDGQTYHLAQWDTWPGPKAERFSYPTMNAVLAAPDRKGREGFVIYFFGSDTHVKVKQEDYVQMHKVVTHLSEKRIWEWLSQGRSFQALIATLPDELFDWVSDVAEDILSLVRHFEAAVMLDYDGLTATLSDANPSWSRKEFAERARHYPHSKALFYMLDGKYITELAWRYAQPTSERPVTWRR